MIDAVFVLPAQPLATRKPRQPHRGQRVRIGSAANEKGRQSIPYAIPVVLALGIDANQRVSQPAASFNYRGYWQWQRSDKG
jgi:hypothetical protein